MAKGCANEDRRASGLGRGAHPGEAGTGLEFAHDPPLRQLWPGSTPSTTNARRQREPKNQYKEPAVTLQIGDVMPDVNLVDQDLSPWSISGHVGRPLVLILHRHLA